MKDSQAKKERGKKFHVLHWLQSDFLNIQIDFPNSRKSQVTGRNSLLFLYLKMFLRENLSSERCRNSTNSTLYLRHCSNATAGREVEQNWWTFSIFECNFDQAWSIAGNSCGFKKHDCRILLNIVVPMLTQRCLSMKMSCDFPRIRDSS